MLWLLAVFVLMGLIWAVPLLHLRGKDLSAYDKSGPCRFCTCAVRI